MRKPARPRRPHLPAQERSVPQLTDDLLTTLRDGELEVLGRLPGSTNNALVVRVRVPAHAPDPHLAANPASAPDVLAVWKPTVGERPLADFPIGTLTRREVAAYRVSEAMGWGIVPPTLLRDGPYGEGMVQQWIDADPDVDVVAMVVGQDPRLRRVAAFDAVVNNTDRKGGHLLPVPGGHLYAVDHGVTFSTVPKLRTLLWAWEGQPFDAQELSGLERVRAALSGEDGSALGTELGELIARREIDATRRRVETLLETGRFPGPNPNWPAVPWPLF